MDLRTFKTACISNKIPKFLIFNVKEQALCRLYLDTMEEVTGLEVRFYGTIEECLKNITNPLTNDEISLVYDDSGALDRGKIAEAKKTDKYIILYYDKPIKPTQETAGDMVEFPKCDRDTILCRLLVLCRAEGVSVSQEELGTLIDRCNGDLGCCENELDKILTLKQANSDAVTEYMLNGNFSDYRRTNAQSLAEKVANKDITAFDDLQRFTDSPMLFYQILYNMARRRFVLSGDSYQLKIMRETNYVYNGIVGNRITSDYALGYLMYELYFD